jgi:hypothetical protein
MPMRDLSAAGTLDLWQAAEALAPVDRALALAAAAGDAAPDELARLPLGRRDARLVELHAAFAGPSLEATALCPSCGEPVEFALDVEALLGSEGRPVEPLLVGGVTIEWRPPDSRDAAAAAAAGDASAAERVLLSRCVTARSLPPEARAAVAEAMAAADPLAEVLADLACPECGAKFVADLDLAGFVWAELRARAERVLRDVDLLARAYGWTEPEVLALGERRREAYLELAAGGGA